MASAGRAQFTVIDDFESYADDAALRAAWVAVAPLASTSVTLDPSQSMSIAYDVSAGVNAVVFDLGSDQDYHLRTTFRVVYEVASGSVAETILLELLDSADGVLLSEAAPNGTSVASEKWEVNLVSLAPSLTAVRKIRFSLVDGGDSAGTGTVLFDDVSVSSGTYSTCRPCHGEFRDVSHFANTDGAEWTPDLHDVHRNLMLAGDCSTCHTGSDRFPVFVGSSDGGTGLPGISCLGCHGREGDIGHDAISSGRAAGLNQHHFRAGVTECAQCHTDADPADYTPVAEFVPPAYYFVPDAAHPDKPANACTFAELFVSPLRGLDNDGDLLYEAADPDCSVLAIPALNAVGIAVSVLLLFAAGLWRLRQSRRSLD